MDDSGVFFGSRRRFPGNDSQAVPVFRNSNPGDRRLHRDCQPSRYVKTEVCLNCYTEGIYAKNCNAMKDTVYLAVWWAGICLTCHLKEDCCKPGLEHLPEPLSRPEKPPDRTEIREIPRASLSQDAAHSPRANHLPHLSSPQPGTARRIQMSRMVKITATGSTGASFARIATRTVDVGAGSVSYIAQ